MKKYRVSKKALHRAPNLSTQIDGKPVSLNGNLQIHITPESKDSPREETPMRIATQADLEKLFKMGDTHGVIEEYDEAEEKAEQALLQEAKKDK
jgi:hypothetical protein